MNSLQTQDQRHPELFGTKIKELIKQIYCSEIIAPLKVIPLCPVGWTVIIGIPAPEKPMTISAELPDDEFLEYLKKELEFAALHARESYTINLIARPWRKINQKKN